jgi:hypothetical protein
MMLYFSDTVWVLTSSSLPARDGALESSNGDAKGPLLSLLPASEPQLDLLDDIAESALGLSTSWYGLGGPFILAGGSNISVDCATSGAPYIGLGPGRTELPVEGLCGNRFLEKPGVPAVECELSDLMLSIKFPPLPELTVMCGGLRPGARLSEDIVRKDTDANYIQEDVLI